jgi:hypothetical protein
LTKHGQCPFKEVADPSLIWPGGYEGGSENLAEQRQKNTIAPPAGRAKSTRRNNPVRSLSSELSLLVKRLMPTASQNGGSLKR